MFQHYAAFKHMTVASNVAFGLEIRKRPKAEIKERVDELLELVHLSQFADRLPSQLSGGQRQRMALARALAVEPTVLLLDEPFGALDAKVRKELRDWLRRLHDEVHVTTVFVTHDQEEALEVADEIVVINDGRIEQIGTPDQLYDEPANDFVMSFLGPVTRLRGQLVRPHDIDVFIADERRPGAVPGGSSGCSGWASRCGSRSVRSRRWAGRTSRLLVRTRRHRRARPLPRPRARPGHRHQGVARREPRHVRTAADRRRAGRRRRDLADHVLAKFEPDERPIVAEAVGRAADAAELFVSRGIGPVMNRFNRKEDKEDGD